MTEEQYDEAVQAAYSIQCGENLADIAQRKAAEKVVSDIVNAVIEPAAETAG